MTGNLIFGMFLALNCHSHLLTYLSVVSGYNPSSALNTVLLVVRQHPSTFSAAVIRTVSSCFTNFAFPSHPSCLRVLYPSLLVLPCVHAKSSCWISTTITRTKIQRRILVQVITVWCLSNKTTIRGSNPPIDLLDLLKESAYLKSTA